MSSEAEGCGTNATFRRGMEVRHSPRFKPPLCLRFAIVAMADGTLSSRMKDIHAQRWAAIKSFLAKSLYLIIFVKTADGDPSGPQGKDRLEAHFAAQEKAKVWAGGASNILGGCIDALLSAGAQLGAGSSDVRPISGRRYVLAVSQILWY